MFSLSGPCSLNNVGAGLALVAPSPRTGIPTNDNLPKRLDEFLL